MELVVEVVFLEHDQCPVLPMVSVVVAMVTVGAACMVAMVYCLCFLS